LYTELLKEWTVFIRYNSCYSLDSGTGSRMNPLQRLLRVPLVDISNKNGTAYSNNCQVIFSRDRPML
jgi:hypothetical protein